eukprot:435266-Pyramimonas_sp.AAC.2
MYLSGPDDEMGNKGVSETEHDVSCGCMTRGYKFDRHVKSNPLSNSPPLLLNRSGVVSVFASVGNGSVGVLFSGSLEGYRATTPAGSAQ